MNNKENIIYAINRMKENNNASKEMPLSPVRTNNNFIIKYTKMGAEIYHTSGKMLFRKNPLNTSQKYCYELYENGLLVLIDRYTNLSYHSTEIKFYNNKGDEIINETYYNNEDSSYNIKIYKNKVCYMGNSERVIADVNTSKEQER